MNVDRIALLDALGRANIRVARTAVADSAAAAEAFAERRTARDPRFVPVRLFVDQPGEPLSAGKPRPSLTSATSVARSFARLGAVARPEGGRVLVQTAVELGTDLAIVCRPDPVLGNVIAIQGRTHEAAQMLPLDAAGAAVLAKQARGFHHRTTPNRTRAMLEHLLLRVAAFFEESGLASLRLDPVRLHGNGYTVLDAVAGGPHELQAADPARSTRDVKGHYRSSGRQ
jgi:hypothetical protein